LSQEFKSPASAQAASSGSRGEATLGELFAAAVAHDRQGSRQEAERLYRAAIALAPHHAEAHNNLGMLYASQGRLIDAIACYHRAISARPDFAAACNNLGMALVALWRLEEAVGQFIKAIAASPNFAEAHSNLATALAALNHYEGAAAHYERAVAIRPGLAAAHSNLANALAVLNRPEEAIAAGRRAIKLVPKAADGYLALANALRTLGRTAELRSVLEKGLKLSPARADLHRALAETKRFAPGDLQLAAMESLARAQVSLPTPQRAALHFALAKAYADLDQPERSFRHLIEGNGLKRREVAYNEAATLDAFRRIEAVFTPELLRQKQAMGDSSPVPIFIFGMPRSGTTLVEQVIASHPQVYGADERMDFSRAAGRLVTRSGMPMFPALMASITAPQLRALGRAYLAGMQASAPDRARITDKMTANFAFAGLIHLALPNAKLIHVRRDPLDTCVSCFSRLFAATYLSYTYDLGELGRYYRGYEKLMAHWRRVLPPGVMLEVQYEELVADFVPQARRIIAYCGLGWDERCLAFHATQRSVRSASAEQVRQPLYDSSVGRWRRYAPMLRPLLDALGPERAIEAG
jgi:tetratricopeptide (TPR) repeat protein